MIFVIDVFVLSIAIRLSRFLRRNLFQFLLKRHVA